jgi:hypothetical protein
MASGLIGQDNSFNMINHKNANSTACLLFLTGIPIILAGCSRDLDRNMDLADLQSPNPTVQVMAIKWAGDNKLSQAVPQLVDLLQHEDRSVRFYAIQSLRRITGTDNGFDYKANPKNRAAAVQRWREFVKSNKEPNYER